MRTRHNALLRLVGRAAIDGSSAARRCRRRFGAAVAAGEELPAEAEKVTFRVSTPRAARRRLKACRGQSQARPINDIGVSLLRLPTAMRDAGSRPRLQSQGRIGATEVRRRKQRRRAAA